jgi:hypothetical protein
MLGTPPFEVAMGISAGFVILVIMVIMLVDDFIRRRRGG